MDKILTIVSLAVSCGGFFALFFNEKKVRVWMAVVVLITTLLSTWLFVFEDANVNRRNIELTKLWILKKTTSQASFEDIFSEAYYPSFEIIEAAIDELVVEGKLGHTVVDVEKDGEKHRLRLYNLIK